MFCLAIQACIAANSTRNLYYTAKVWGYLKYFHPAVNGCNKNLDSILVALIPEVEGDSTDSSLNASLLKMFDYAGPMPTATTPAPTLTPDETINLDLAWQHDTALSPEVQALLDSIRVNFRPVQTCYYEWNANRSPSDLFPYQINEKDYSPTIAIMEPYRLLTLFRIWNIYGYFYPYKTLLDQSWDTVLMDMIPVVRLSQTTLSFQLALMEFQAHLQDAHAVTNSQILADHFGFNCLPMIFSYIDSQTVITKVFKGVTAVKPGDVVLDIDGTPTQTIRDSLLKYTPGGNASVINRNISTTLLQGTSLTAILVVDDGSGPQTVSINRTASEAEVGDSMFHWQGDGSHWKVLSGGIGYINMGIADSLDVDEMFPALKNASAIIFDLRNYPQSNILYQCCDSLIPSSVPFARWFFPDPTFPGTGQISITNCGSIPYNSYYYKGKVILLVNEITQSAAEFTTMALSKAPKAIIVGSQTAGADGDVTATIYPTEAYMYYTSYGVSFSDGRKTQQVGIVPNVVVKPTIVDIRVGVDPVLDTAIILAGGKLVVKEQQFESGTSKVFPNPAHDVFMMTIPTSDLTLVTLSNSLGETVWSHSIEPSDRNGTLLSISPGGSLSPGIYFIRVSNPQNGIAYESTVVEK